jgi:hypothetical protein
MFNVYMKMESGASLLWQGPAENTDHAVGMAIAWATRNGDKVYDYDTEEEAV